MLEVFGEHHRDDVTVDLYCWYAVAVFKDCLEKIQIKGLNKKQSWNFKYYSSQSKPCDNLATK